MPRRETPKLDFKAPALESLRGVDGGSKGRAVSTTMGFVSMLRHLLKDPAIGKLIVPIVPDEGRTFGLESVIRQVGIYASEGQQYKPHDADMLLYYREEKDGQILEEGITEAGSMASFTAAGTAYSNYRRADDSVLHVLLDVRLPARRRHDLGLRRCARQGLPDGRHRRPHHHARRRAAAPGRHSSSCWPSTVPTCATYDPAYVYELAVIVQDGIRRMYQEGEDLFYYITMYNEDYAMPAMPEGVTRRHPARHLPLQRGSAGQGRGCSSSAAVRS